MHFRQPLLSPKVDEAVCLILCALSGERSPAETTLSCVELSDPDRTRVLVELDARIERLEIVTPELLWSAPGQRETRRFAAGKSDTSPNLAGRDGVYVEELRGGDGSLRGVDFGVVDPDALEVCVFRVKLDTDST